MTATPIAIAIVLWEGQVLIGQRPADVPLAGFWEFPGGKVEAGELPADAAVRECREETGLDVEVVGEFPGVLHRYRHGQVELHFFECILRQPAALPRDPFLWVKAGDLASYQFPSANAEIVAHLCERK